MPAVAADIRRAFAAADAGDVAGAAALLDRDLAAHPGIAGLHAARAGVAMLEDAPDAALDHLAAAARAPGLPDLAAVAADPVFAPLAADPGLAPRLAALAATPPAPPPAPVARRRSPRPRRPRARRRRQHRLEPGDRAARGRASPCPPASPAPCCPPGPKTGALDILREHWKRGRAAGNAGDLYDNRDRGHSALKPEAFPQLAHVAYPPAARAAELDYGLAGQARSSTARPSATPRPRSPAASLWRSLPRLAMTQADGTGPLRLWQNAEAQRPLRLPRPQGLDARARRPLPGEHPLHPRQPRLLGLGPALPRGGGADLRRLPPRHQGAARRRSTCSCRPCR